MPGREELPATIRRSPKQAQDTWIKAHDAAVKTYGEGRRSHQTAFAALKHKFDKVGDHWERKARQSAARDTRDTAEGVDARAPKQHLYEIAKKLDIAGRSRMGKSELVSAIRKANRRETAQARRG